MMKFAPLLLWAPTLFDQSVVRILTRDFPQAQYLLVSVATREVIGKRWPFATEPIPLGSLVKPFTALTLGASPGRARCDPRQCWHPAGHGDVDLITAIAESCNSYFLQKVRQTHTDKTPETLIGLGDAWKIAPEQMAINYAALPQTPNSEPILEGMRRSAATGTAKLLGGGALAKTGTAPCRHKQRAPGDGYVAILYPSDIPKYVLLVQVHGVSGAEATRTAAKMLQVLKHGK